MTDVRKRRGQSTLSTKTKNSSVDKRYGEKNSGEKTSPVHQQTLEHFQWRHLNFLAGIVAMAVCAYIHGWFMYMLHENNLWFSNIKVS